MSIEDAIALVRSEPEAAWELAPLLPHQGEWSAEEYFWLSNRSRRLVEFADGYVQVLPMPTEEHQRILMFLYRRGAAATSALLPGLSFSVDDALDGA